MGDDAVPMEEDAPQSAEAQAALARLDAAEEMEAKEAGKAIEMYKQLIASGRTSEHCAERFASISRAFMLSHPLAT